MWSARVTNYSENLQAGRVANVKVELLENNQVVYQRTMTENEYNSCQ
jgi:hypothetical protein